MDDGGSHLTAFVDATMFGEMLSMPSFIMRRQAGERHRGGAVRWQFLMRRMAT